MHLGLLRNGFANPLRKPNYAGVVENGALGNCSLAPSLKTRSARRVIWRLILMHSHFCDNATLQLPRISQLGLRWTSLMRAGEVLDTMRKDHEENGCGFFAFTVIRSPLDWIVSLYDDICHRRLRGHTATCPQQVSCWYRCFEQADDGGTGDRFGIELCSWWKWWWGCAVSGAARTRSTIACDNGVGVGVVSCPRHWLSWLWCSLLGIDGAFPCSHFANQDRRSSNVSEIRSFP